jgi:hypothetical protein
MLLARSHLAAFSPNSIRNLWLARPYNQGFVATRPGDVLRSSQQQPATISTRSKTRNR